MTIVNLESSDNLSAKAKVLKKTNKIVMQSRIKCLKISKFVDKYIVISRFNLKYQFWKNFIIFCNIASSYYYLHVITQSKHTKLQRLNAIDIVINSVFLVDLVVNFLVEKEIYCTE